MLVFLVHHSQRVGWSETADWLDRGFGFGGEGGGEVSTKFGCKSVDEIGMG
jgi:hypothetical protein